jgi:phosphohistidine phosphatase SixA
MRTRVAAALAVLLAVAAPVAAQSTVFVVRHAERADAGMPKTAADPDLSSIGHTRAESLAVALRDGGITAIFVTPLKRTQQTAAPLAKLLKLTPVVVEANDAAGLAKRLLAHRGAALVVGHSNTVPEIVKLLGITEAVTIGDSEFDRLFVVVRPEAGKPVLVPLRFQ